MTKERDQLKDSRVGKKEKTYHEFRSAFRSSSSLCSACACEQHLRKTKYLERGLFDQLYAILMHLTFLKLDGYAASGSKSHLPCCRLNSWVYPFLSPATVKLSGLGIPLPLFHYVSQGRLNDLSNQSSTQISLKCCLFFKLIFNPHFEQICIFGETHKRWKVLFQMFFTAFRKHFQNFHTTVNTAWLQV